MNPPSSTLTSTATLTATAVAGSVPAATRPASMASRITILAAGSAIYALFLATFLYVIAFVGDVFVPKTIDSGAAGPLGVAIAVNGAFLALFALQHAIMARPEFKARWTKVVPRAIERSLFVLATCTILLLMVWQWRPMPGIVWETSGALAWGLIGLSALGWLTVLVSTFLIDHFELFGLRQVVLHALGKPYEPPRFRERALYKLVRHPIMLGFLIAFWATPVMTQGHLLFALLTTGYILVGVQLEERDLVRAHGERYLNYRRRVRGILPLPKRAA